MTSIGRTILIIGIAVVLVAAYFLFAQLPSPPSADRSGPGPALAPPAAIAIREPGLRGSAEAIGCGDHLWTHVYRPERLEVENDCITVTGVLVDATATEAHPRADGVRKEADGDTHGWLRLDPGFENLLNAGNDSDEDGNLVFEVVCHWRPSQSDAKPACTDYVSAITLPPLQSHVALTGTLVRDDNHARWREVHPVSRIVIQ